MKYHLFVSYRSDVSGRWLKYRSVDFFESYMDAEYYGDMILANHLSGTARYKIV